MSSRTLAVAPALNEFDTSTQPRSARAELVERLAARISASTNEIAPFADVDRAIIAIATRLFVGRRVVLAQPVADRVARSARAFAGQATDVDWRDTRADAACGSMQEAAFKQLVRFANDADTLVLTSPFVESGSANFALSPRDLLRLRARAPRPVIVLDLLDEELARAPLTQAALLLPGTIALRGFGDVWREAGATNAADLVYVAGAPDLVAMLQAEDHDGAVDDGRAAAVVRDLQQTGIERIVQEAATRRRVPYRRE